jgi:hypothetical protein
MESRRGGERDLGDAENPSFSDPTTSRDKVFHFDGLKAHNFF